jgi:hypothetical protein
MEVYMKPTSRIKTIVVAAAVTFVITIAVEQHLKDNLSIPFIEKAYAQISEEEVIGSIPKKWGKLVQADFPKERAHLTLQADDGTIRHVTFVNLMSRGGWRMSEVSVFKRN